jgi:hypothetical protein
VSKANGEAWSAAKRDRIRFRFFLDPILAETIFLHLRRYVPWVYARSFPYPSDTPLNRAILNIDKDSNDFASLVSALGWVSTLESFLWQSRNWIENKNDRQLSL